MLDTFPVHFRIICIFKVCVTKIYLELASSIINEVKLVRLNSFINMSLMDFLPLPWTCVLLFMSPLLMSPLSVGCNISLWVTSLLILNIHMSALNLLFDLSCGHSCGLFCCWPHLTLYKGVSPLTVVLYYWLHNTLSWIYFLLLLNFQR